MRAPTTGFATFPARFRWRIPFALDVEPWVDIPANAMGAGVEDDEGAPRFARDDPGVAGLLEIQSQSLPTRPCW